MHKIVFHYLHGESQTYSGGTFTSRGEKYAAMDNKNPKLYKSEKVARNAAEKLFLSCENTGIRYSIVEVFDDLRSAE